MNFLTRSNQVARPEKTIDWDLVDRLLEAQCSAREIAGNLGIHEDTLYNRTKEKYKMNYSDYSAKVSSRGVSLLKVAQFKKALSGNPNMLIWLGKIILKQKEQTNDTDVSESISTQYSELMSQLKSLQSSDSKIEDNSINNERKS